MPASALHRTKSAALVFVPGISRSWDEGSLRKMADDIAVALNHNQKGATFTVAASEHLQVPVGADSRAVRRVSIQRSSPADGEVEASLDLYELEYLRGLVDRQERQPLLVRAAKILLTILAGARQFLAFTPLRKGKTTRERAQLLAVLFLLLLYAAFLGILVAAILLLAAETWNDFMAVRDAGSDVPAVSPSAAPAAGSSAAVTPPPSRLDSYVGRAVQFVAMVAAFLWFVLPPRHAIKEAITNTATDYLGAQWYLSQSTGAKQIAGGFVGVLNALVDEDRHGRIDVVAYSLGSVVAINQLFPAGVEPPENHPVRSVDTLVTVGSPYDLIRLLLPDYFKHRHPAHDVPKRWLNIYTPDDILGSNFRDDARQEQPQSSVIQQMAGSPTDNPGVRTPENLPYLPGGVPGGGGPFGGLRVHGSYWSEKPGDETCWSIVVPRLYGSHALLAASKPATQEAPVPAQPA